MPFRLHCDAVTSRSENERPATPMKPLTIIILGMGFLAAMAALCAFWLWFMLQQPIQSAASDKLDDFWVRKGIMPLSFAEKCKRFKWGWKLLVGMAVFALIESAGGFLVLTFLIIRSVVLLTSDVLAVGQRRVAGRHELWLFDSVQVGRRGVWRTIERITLLWL